MARKEEKSNSPQPLKSYEKRVFTKIPHANNSMVDRKHSIGPGPEERYQKFEKCKKVRHSVAPITKRKLNKRTGTSRKLVDQQSSRNFQRQMGTLT